MSALESRTGQRMVLLLDNSPRHSPSPVEEDTRPSLIGLGRAELGEALASVGVPPKHLRMRITQLWSWIYVRGVTSFDQLTDISKDLRARLDAAYTLARPEIVTEQVSVDGTRKWLLRLPRR